MKGERRHLIYSNFKNISNRSLKFASLQLRVVFLLTRSLMAVLCIYMLIYSNRRESYTSPTLFFVYVQYRCQNSWYVSRSALKQLNEMLFLDIINYRNQRICSTSVGEKCKFRPLVQRRREDVQVSLSSGVHYSNTTKP